jgi:hypothetical protein
MDPPTTPRTKAWRFDALAAAAIFAAGMLLYVRTLIPTLLLGDGAEFQILGYTLGIGHPTGYPVYLLLVKLITLIPVEDIAYRANLSSAVYASLALAVIYLAARCLKAHPLAALAGPVALALSPMFWWHAVMAEAYTPAAACIALVLLLVLRGRSNRPMLLFWAGLLGGLSPGVHGMVPLIAPGVLIYLLVGSHKNHKWKKAWLLAAAGAVLGLGLYVGAFWALDRNNPPSNNLLSSARYNLDVWNIDPADYEAHFFTRFRYLASGQMFHGAMLKTGKSAIASQWKVYLTGLREQFSPVFIVLVGLGIAWLLLRSSWREALLLAASWGGLLFFVLTYQIGDIFVFHIPTYVPLAMAACLGADALLAATGWLAARLPSRASRLAAAPVGVTTPVGVKPALQVAIGLALVWGVVYTQLDTLSASWKEKRITFLDGTDYRWYPYPVEDPQWPKNHASSIVDVVEDDAMIFTDWGMLYPIFYVAHVEQGRTGINVFETYRSMNDGQPSEMTLDYIRENLSKRPVYVTQMYDRMKKDFEFIKIKGIDLWQVTGTR